MKTLFKKNILALVTLFSLFAMQNMLAQTAVTVTVESIEEKALLVSFPSTNIDSLGTYQTNKFTLAGYDWPSTLTVYWTRLLSSTTGKPRILAVVKGSNTPATSTSWQVVDTLSVNADSTETWGKGSVDFNSNKFAYYVIHVTGTATNRDDTYAQFQLYIPNKKRE